MINGLGGVLKLVAMTGLKWLVCRPRQNNSWSKILLSGRDVYMYVSRKKCKEISFF